MAPADTHPADLGSLRMPGMVAKTWRFMYGAIAPALATALRENWPS
jgi:hypothetical protein